MGLFDSFKGLFGGGAALPVFNVEKRFELLGRTGQGSMSKVWKARDRVSGKLLCLKILDKEKTEKFEARFVGLKKPSEGEISLSMKHPNIVNTFEYGVTTNREPCLLMEFVDGVGLNFLIETKSEKLDGHRVDYLKQLATGIEALHKAGYLHRDICPRNVMVTNDEVVKIIDLGLAIPYKPEFCAPGNRTGTTNYLAPELIKRQSTDHRVDMFALGVTAYEVFTGTTPWEKAASLQLLLSKMNSPGRDPREIRKDLDLVTVGFLNKAIERDPKKRFQTPSDFRDALDRCPEQ